MKLLVGPIVYFRGQEEDLWNLSVLVVGEGVDQPPDLLADTGRATEAVAIAHRQGCTFWRYDLALALGNAARATQYRIGADAWPLRLPAKRGPRRLAYVACSGTEERANWGTPSARNALWRQFGCEHDRQPFELLLHGGDQLYADSVWSAVPELAAWNRRTWRKAHAAPFTATMQSAVDAHYFHRYRTLWSQADLAPTLASVPSIMMWDDHDIFDGWGSWPTRRQTCAVFRGIGAIARDYFGLFQLAIAPTSEAAAMPGSLLDPEARHFGGAFRIGELAIMVPDLRSERTKRQMMGPAGWADFERGLERVKGCRHLLLMSSVPLVNASLDRLERLINMIPGHSDYEDDLRDQWQSYVHRDEWIRMLRSIVAFARSTGARVTALAGEIHVGALGIVRSGDVLIHSLTSSAIVHPPPSRLAMLGYLWLGRRKLELAEDLQTALLDMPGLDQPYLRRRNWLGLDASGDGGFRARWHTETGVPSILSVRGAGEEEPRPLDE